MSDEKGGGSGSGGSSSRFLTFSSVTAAVLVAAVSVCYSYYGKQDTTLLELLLAKVMPAECFETSPPPDGCVNHVFPWMILAIMTSMVGYAIKTFLFDKPSQVILDIIEQEFDKRHEVTQGLLEELDSSFVHDEGDENIELFNSGVVYEKLVKLLELPNYRKKTAGEAFRWLWIVLAKDLRVSLKLTSEGEDIKFSDGVKLRNCVNQFDRMMVKARIHGCRPEGSERKKLYKLKWEAKKYLMVHGIKTVKKAVKMSMLAKEAFPWLLLQAICTTATAVMSPLTLHYRVHALENLDDVKGDLFWASAKAMVLVELLASVLGILTNMVQMQADNLATKEMMVAYYDGLLKMPVTFWSMQAKMDWGSKISIRHVYSFNHYVTKFLAIPQSVLKNLATSLTYAYLVIRTSSRTLLLLACANVGSICLSWVLNKFARWLSLYSLRGVIEASDSDWSSCVYSLCPEYISTYLSFVRGPLEVQRLAKIQTGEAEISKRLNLVGIFSRPVSAMVSQGSTIAQLSSARTNVIDQGMGIADADGMMKSAERFVDEAQTVIDIFGDVVSMAEPLAKAYDIISLPRTIDPDTGLWPKHKARGRIEFKDVRFKYPRKDVEVLKGITFNVQPGDTIGMTGSAGCGKSTCMRLLERFYDVSAGSILLDGVDIREYNPRWLRGQIATVAQEPKLVPITIRENLTFGCVDREPTLEEIHDALRAANIYDSIMDKDKFPQGLRTEIDSVGNVSGGEKQRIAIARAILADPPILLLDEATSALDEDNQEKVQEALNRLMKGRTTLVIAHRLSTIKNSSKIVAFHKGKVFEEGTHDDLLTRKDSLYAKLWNKQTTKISVVEDEDDKEEEEEEIEPLEVEAGMNPKPTGLRRLETLLQDLPDSDPKKKEIQSICKMLEKEKQGDVTNQRFIKRGALDKWGSLVNEHKVADKDGSNKFKSLGNKVMFNNASEKIKASLSERELLSSDS